MRGHLTSVAAAVAALAAAALVAAPAAAQSGPIKLGFLTVDSGPVGVRGKQMEQGIQLFLKERNGMLSGRKVELTMADTGGKPALAKTKTEELVERDRVNVIIGPLAAFEALAITDYIKQAQVPIISDSAAAEDLTQRRPNPWFVRAVATSAQPNHPLGDYAAKELHMKRMAMIADDFAYGQEGAAGFQRAFEDAGGKIVQKLWPPLNTTDYGPFIAQIKRDVDGIYAGFAGANGLRFLKQYEEYGLKGKIPVLASMTTVDEGVLKSMGEEAAGVISTGWYSAAIDTPGNKKFVAAFRKAYGSDPGYYSMGAYLAGLFLEEALKTTSGKIEDKAAFMKALRAVKLKDSPLGPVSLDEHGNPVFTIYIRKVEKQNGHLVNAVIHRYPKVSQFWTYDPQKFLAQPVYSRDYPPAKNLE
jgi:branched-chain amino acid transport system substrate-binding protein